MVMDILTISSFVILVLYKVLLSINSMSGGKIYSFPVERIT
jgi:hypothetical protein